MAGHDNTPEFGQFEPQITALQDALSGEPLDQIICDLVTHVDLRIAVESLRRSADVFEAMLKAGEQ